MKSTLIILSILSLSLFLNGCGESSADGLDEYTVVHKENNGPAFTGHDEKTILILTNQANYEEKAVLFGHTPVTIDFTEYSVVFISMGEKSQTGYSFDVVGFEQLNLTNAPEYESDYSTIKVQSSIPSKDCITADALTTPHIFIQIPAASNVLVEESIIARCD